MWERNFVKINDNVGPVVYYYQDWVQQQVGSNSFDKTFKTYFYINKSSNDISIMYSKPIFDCLVKYFTLILLFLG